MPDPPRPARRTGRRLSPPERAGAPALGFELAACTHDGRATGLSTTDAAGADGTAMTVPTYTNEFWTSRQRAANSLHEVSYRACFKPQLPRFFIERLTVPGDRVHDPFMGRGTTLLEAALLGRRPAGCDVNPLSRVLVAPRLTPPTAEAVKARLASLDLGHPAELPEDLLVFYHRDTLRQLCALRAYLLRRQAAGELDAVDSWIRMVAVNRLTGHSPGFFSIYTLPPNQAVSIDVQRKINRDRDQAPPLRDVAAIILKKTRSLLADCDAQVRADLASVAGKSLLMTAAADDTPLLADASVDLVVTSPPFLDVVDYAADNWLRCWFCGIDPAAIDITLARKTDEWRAAMTRVFGELHRVVRPGGHVAFEVGEVRSGRVKLEQLVVPAATVAGFTAELILINSQAFTKTANCWGVDNNRKGTNTNRVVLLRRPA